MIIKHEASHITNTMLKHLMEWVVLCEDLIHEDNPFQDLEELASQLEWWRKEFARNGHITDSDQVNVVLYGDEVILITDKIKGEFIKIKKELKHVNT